jgi:hypothetical protein
MVTVAIGEPPCDMGHTPPKRPSLYNVTIDIQVNHFHHLPNHQFVVTTAVDVIGIGCGKDVVGYVAPNVGRIIIPRDLRWHALYLRNRLAFSNLAASIRITLHVVLASLPRPTRTPFDTGAGGALIIGALGARSGCVFTPEIVQAGKTVRNTMDG